MENEIGEVNSVAEALARLEQYQAQISEDAFILEMKVRRAVPPPPAPKR